MKYLLAISFLVLMTVIPTFGQQKPLILAVLEGDVAKATQLIQNGADVNEENDEGWRPIIVAFSREIEPTTRYQLVQLLASNKADLNVSIEKRSPLWIAFRSNEPELVKLLINYGADMDAPTAEGDTFIEWVTMAKSSYSELREFSNDWSCKNLDLVEYIFDKGLFGAQYMEQENMVRAILYVAAKCNNTSLLKKFIKKGVDVNLMSRYKETALHAACYHKKIEAVQLLLDAGAKQDIKGAHGIPLEYVIESDLGTRTHPVVYNKSEQWAILRLLLKKGTKEYDYFPHYKVGSALFRANAPIEVITHCYEQGVKFDEARINGGVTPIMVAAQYDRLQSFKFLAIKYPEGIHATDQSGWSVYDHALGLPLFIRSRKPVKKYGRKYGVMVTKIASEDNVDQILDVKSSFQKYLLSRGLTRGDNKVKFYEKEF